MPIYGRVNGDTQRITIRVNISNGEQEYRVIEAEIDTASSEALAMPPQTIADLGLAQLTNTDYRQNGASGDAPTYVAQVEWHNGPISVGVVETDRPAYAGMGLLWDSYLSAYLFPNGAVDVTRMVHWDDIKREAEEE